MEGNGNNLEPTKKSAGKKQVMRKMEGKSKKFCYLSSINRKQIAPPN
jgi:hypothetical protein